MGQLEIYNNGVPRCSDLEYLREKTHIGVLHIGPGAFFRAHQADYFDRLLSIDPNWAIDAVALKTRSSQETLAPQDFLYTLCVLDNEPSYRTIGSVHRISHVHEESWIQRFCDPALKLVTMTITEKGYYLNADGTLNEAHEDIQADLDFTVAPRTAFGLILRGLQARYNNGLAPPVLLSCDNISNNGSKLRQALIAMARLAQPILADRIMQELKTPSAMVDSITPASDEKLRDRVLQQTGVEDKWPIQREAFISWVIEDCALPELSLLQHVGVVFTNNLAVHEHAKLRLLNGPHSALAYLGLAKGHALVHQAMADTELRQIIDNIAYDEVIPGLPDTDELNGADYYASVCQRFSNPHINHKLSQIAWDGSKKLPIRLLSSIEENLEAKRPIDNLSLAIAAWIRFICRAAQNATPITDPMADTLLAKAATATGQPSDILLFTAIDQIFPSDIANNEIFGDSLQRAYQRVLVMEEGA